MNEAWPAIEAARRRSVPRVRFWIGDRPAGSVAVAHLPALGRFAPTLAVADDGVRLVAPRERIDAVLAEINQVLRDDGLIAAWRDETYAVFALDVAGAGGTCGVVCAPSTLEPLAHIERAASRFWGTLSFGAHANGWVAGPDGRPERMWIATRSLRKAVDPGLLDNLIGGGVPAGQTPHQTLLREGFEEAGLDDALLRRARPGRVLALDLDIPQGVQFEQLHVFDLELPPGRTPRNQDGEVERFECLPIVEVLALAAGARGPRMTTDAALVVLDFALRHQLVAAAERPSLEARCAGLFVAP